MLPRTWQHKHLQVGFEVFLSLLGPFATSSRFPKIQTSRTSTRRKSKNSRNRIGSTTSCSLTSTTPSAWSWSCWATSVTPASRRLFSTTCLNSALKWSTAGIEMSSSVFGSSSKPTPVQRFSSCGCTTRSTRPFQTWRWRKRWFRRLSSFKNPPTKFKTF